MTGEDAVTDPVTVAVPEDGDAIQGVVTAWFVKAGDSVSVGDPLAEVAIDKADVAVAAPASGVVDRLHAPLGATVHGGQALVTIREEQVRVSSPATADPTVEEPAHALTSTVVDGRSRVEELPAIRKTIARTMMRSLGSTAQLTSIVPADVTRIMELRAEVRDHVRRSHGVSLSPLAFLARAACMALPRHPAINASMSADATTATYHDYVGLGVAVDTPRGLVVVNVPDAQELSVTGLAVAVAEIAQRARSQSLRPEDVRGSTFTITNTGSNGTLMGTPILNPPQAAILATYAIQRRPVVVADAFGADAIVPRSIMNLALTYDHRLIDGADAGRFLKDMRWLIEEHDLSEEL